MIHTQDADFTLTARELAAKVRRMDEYDGASYDEALAALDELVRRLEAAEVEKTDG